MQDLFRREARAQIADISARLNAQSEPNLNALVALTQRVHNGARLAGFEAVGAVASELLEVFLRAQAGDLQLDGPALAAISDAVEQLRSKVDDETADAAPEVMASLGRLSGRPGGATERPEPEPKAKLEPDAKAGPPEVPRSSAAAPPMDAMRELLRQEINAQIEVLTRHLLTVEQGRATARDLEALMRSAHSVKGGARITGVNDVMALAHAMEDLFVAAQNQALTLESKHLDCLFRALDALAAAAENDQGAGLDGITEEILALLHAAESGASASAAAISTAAEVPAPGRAGLDEHAASGPAPSTADKAAAPPGSVASTETPGGAEPAGARGAESRGEVAGEARNRRVEGSGQDGVIRVSAQGMNRLMGLSGELAVESRRLQSLRQTMLRNYRWSRDLQRAVEGLGTLIQEQDAPLAVALRELPKRLGLLSESQQQVIADLEAFEYRTSGLAEGMHSEVVRQRMRPFGEHSGAYLRLTRDLSRRLGKPARLEVRGDRTPVDRDILEQLNVPLTHLIQNAIDHGLESAGDRLAAGKPAEGRVVLEARHQRGRLTLLVEDDGRGVDLEQLRQRIVERGLAHPDMLAAMSEAELYEFLFLPSFSLKPAVDTVSGRGVGLDVVRTMVQSVRGNIHVSSRSGCGTRIELQLPVTLSVIRSLLVEVGGELYALPIARINRVLRLPLDEVHTLAGKEVIDVDGEALGLVEASQVLGVKPGLRSDSELSLVVLGAQRSYGLVVDRLVGESELVERPLDARLGKVRDVSAVATVEDGRLALILDVDDLTQSMDKLIASAGLGRIEQATPVESGPKRKRVLVVDDSITVREVERGLLGSRGYEVDVAVDGIDGWNAIRMGGYDLVITDVDMPRMDGIALVSTVRADERHRDLPMMIVSYKDREADRRRGLEAGADYYLTKGAFQDETLVEAVQTLIGVSE
jgi:two-component system sensor histidine kinase and response regulator WspE